MPPAAVNDDDDDDVGGGLTILQDTPQDALPEDIIVAEFRAGNYVRLEQAFSSSLAVMRSLLDGKPRRWRCCDLCGDPRGRQG